MRDSLADDSGDGWEKRDFTIALPNLVAILGSSLYSSWEVAIRELVQNAHDAIQRLQLRTPAATERVEGSVRIECTDEANLITIEDDGEGMTREQVESDLSCIGTGASSQLRRTLVREGRSDKAQQIIGQFGIGLLASFLIADRVSIQTRGYGTTPEEGTLWVSRGGAGYQMKTIRKKEHGTRIELRLGLADTPSFPPFYIQQRRALALAEVTQPGRLEEVIRRYCELLPMSIRCNGRELSLRSLPWERGGDAQGACLHFLRRRLGDVPDDVIVLREEWCDEIVGGVLFVGSRPPQPPMVGSPIALFVQRMYVREHDGTILPSWARFLSGALNVWGLAPDLDRDDVKRDHAFVHTTSVLGKAIQRALKEMAEQEPGRFEQFATRHSTVLRRWISKMPSELVRLFAPVLTFTTVAGQRSLPQVREGQRPADGRTLVFASETSDLRRSLFGGFADVGCLLTPADDEELAALQATVDVTGAFRLKKYTIEPERILPQAQDDHWRILERFCEENPWLNMAVQVSHFPNTDVPGLVLRREMRPLDRDTMSGLVGPELNMKAIVARLEEAKPMSAVAEAFFLNADCDVCARMAAALAARDVTSSVREAVRLGIRAIWDAARAISDDHLTPERALRLLNSQRDLAHRLMAMAEADDTEEELSPDAASSLSCLLICPFDDKADGLRAIIENELRSIDTRWSVDRADRSYVVPELFPNIVRMAQRANLCIADLTGFNPNVMLELGLVLGMKKRFIPLISRNDIENPPTDLQHLTLEPYDPASMADGIGRALRKILDGGNRG